MVKYTPTSQHSLFEHPFGGELDPKNRWVRLADSLPWDKLVKVYAAKLVADKGRPSIEPRVVLAALMIKHLKNLPDREVIEEISENIYLQYFAGYSGFRKEPAFDASLFVTLRKRMGNGDFDKMTVELAAIAEGRAGKMDGEGNDNNDGPEVASSMDGNKDAPEGEKIMPDPDVKIKVDATVVPQNILYPTDLKLLNEAREITERLIDVAWSAIADKVGRTKPRTYRVEARIAYLDVVKKKKKTKKVLRRAIKAQLAYVGRNLRTIGSLLGPPGNRTPWGARDLRLYWVVQHVYSQQYAMHKDGANRCDDRIVNIYQPYVRPMVRGKDNAGTEFGMKVNVSLCNGFARVHEAGWDAYNEAVNLDKIIDEVAAERGKYPGKVLADKIYFNRENRAMMGERGIKHIGRPLGRPAKTEPAAERHTRKEMAERNHIEGKFGQGKTKYGLGRIKARTSATSYSWMAGSFFAMNLVNFLKLTPLLVLAVLAATFFGLYLPMPPAIALAIAALTATLGSESAHRGKMWASLGLLLRVR